jgi:exosortase E/protease (VPEID-CTERM system)
LAIGFLFQTGTRNSQTQRWALFLQPLPSLGRLGIATFVAMLLIAGQRFWKEYGQRSVSPWQPTRFGLGVVCHLMAFSGFAGLTVLALQKGLPTTSWPVAWAAAWAGLGLVTLASLGLTVGPPWFWGWLLRRGWVALPASLAVGVAAVVAGKLADQMWQPLGQWSLWIVCHALTLAGVEAVYEPATLTVGTASFAIRIAPNCSGYQGIGLICVVLSVYLWLFRGGLRFPRALLLVPLGVVAVWLTNALRLIALVALGTWVSRDLALGGFHSQAGWLAFLAVGLGLAAVAQRTRFFSAAETAAVQPGRNTNPTAAYLAPLLALVIVSMVTGAFTATFDHFYPLRALAVAGALWLFRQDYADLRWTWSWTAVAVGAVVFALWLLLEPVRTEAAADALPTELAELPPAWASWWLCLRVVGSVVTVPIAEELAFRGFLTRRLIASEFQELPLGRFTWLSFLLSSVLFGVLHGRWLAGTLAGMLYALALYRRGELADAVVAHATTNALLAAYVLMTGAWALWS